MNQNKDTDIVSLLDMFSELAHKFRTVLKNKETTRDEIENKIKEIEKEIGNKRKEIEKDRKVLNKLVKDLGVSTVNGKSSDSTSRGKLTEAENCLFQDISDVRNVVDLSVTGLTEDSLPILWRILKNYENLTSLGVAMTNGTVITLPDFNGKLMGNLKKLRIEGSHSGLEKLDQLGMLDDLTLVSHKKMDFGKIPDIPKLLCLQLYGVCPKETCKIDLNGCPNLKKVVIGNMKTVEIVKNCSAVLKVAYTDKQSSAKSHSRPRRDKSEAHGCSKGVKPNKTLLQKFGDVCVEHSPGLEIDHYDEKMQCYELKATQNSKR